MWLNFVVMHRVEFPVYWGQRSTHEKIHTKMARFWLVCSGEIPVKSDKVALIEGKTFNVMFLVIPVVPTENWLRLTHNQSRKTFKVTALFLRPHRGSNAALACQNSRKWLGILREDFFVGKKCNQRQAFEWVVKLVSVFREATQKLSRSFLKTFAAVFPDPTDGPQVSEDAAHKEPNVHQRLRACQT